MKHKLKSGSSFEIVDSGDTSILSVSEAGSVTIAGTAVATQDDIDELEKSYEYEGSLLLNDANTVGFSSIDEIKNTDIIKWKITNWVDLTSTHTIGGGATIVFRKQCQTKDDHHIIFTADVAGYYVHGPNSIPFVLQLTFGRITTGIEGYVHAYRIDKGTASQISYDNDESGLSAVNVQDAIDELAMGSMPTTDSVFGDIGSASPYTKEQLINIALKYNHNGFNIANAHDIAKITYLNPNATYTEDDLWASTILIISVISNLNEDVDENGRRYFQIANDPYTAQVLYFYYTDENTIMSGISEL